MIILLEMANLRDEYHNVPCHCGRPPPYDSHDPHQREQNPRTSYEDIEQVLEDFQDVFMELADEANRWSEYLETINKKLKVPAPDVITPDWLKTLSEWATYTRESVEVFEDQAMALEETADVLDAVFALDTERYALSKSSLKGSKRTRASTKRHSKLWTRLFRR
ncbi:unnamed protein product [Penicillium bialowiezense]